MSAKAKLQARLSGYWKMEVGNAVLVPAFLIYFSYLLSQPPGWVSYVCFVPMILLLLVGGFYWRGKYHQLKGDTGPLEGALKFAHMCERPLLLMLIVQTGLLLMIWLPFGPTSYLTDKVVASIALSLAVLEHINYYHRQLQHFDNGADFQRFLSGKGFRPAQMAVDLKRRRAMRR